MFDENVWKNFPGTVTGFEKTFPDEGACRKFLIQTRWSGRPPECAKCGHKETWELSNGLFECKSCGHQTSVTAGTPLHGTRKPLKLWFRAIWEIAVRRNGTSAKDLQRIMGFGSYETAWTWMHKLRSCMVRPDREPLKGTVYLDEGYIGGPNNRVGRPNGVRTAAVFVAAEHNGRIRMEHSPNVKGKWVKSFVERNIAQETRVTTDAFNTYSESTLGSRDHEQVVQKKAKLKKYDPLQQAHFALSLMKRLWIGTYHGGIHQKHLQRYLDEYEFRYNRRKTKGVARVTVRLFQILFRKKPLPYKDIISSVRCSRFATA